VWYESLESSVLDCGANHVVVDAPNPKLGHGRADRNDTVRSSKIPADDTD
jgi:hypothetical protein